MKLLIDKEWCQRMATLEGDAEIGAGLVARDPDMTCPRCNSPDPARHPAMQFEGEVEICPHPFHTPVIDKQ